MSGTHGIVEQSDFDAAPCLLGECVPEFGPQFVRLEDERLQVNVLAGAADRLEHGRECRVSRLIVLPKMISRCHGAASPAVTLGQLGEIGPFKIGFWLGESRPRSLAEALASSSTRESSFFGVEPSSLCRAVAARGAAKRAAITEDVINHRTEEGHQKPALSTRRRSMYDSCGDESTQRMVQSGQNGTEKGHRENRAIPSIYR